MFFQVHIFRNIRLLTEQNRKIFPLIKNLNPIIVRQIIRYHHFDKKSIEKSRIKKTRKNPLNQLIVNYLCLAVSPI